jgi:hypothetical protein
MQSIVVDILNERAVALLKDLESLQLIKLRVSQQNPNSKVDWTLYKGAMTKEPISEVDKQLSNLRESWE